jgi:hypothetical protein
MKIEGGRICDAKFGTSEIWKNDSRAGLDTE